MQAIILAAGMGRRLGEYTKDNTKCMLPVNGVRLIDRLLSQLSKLELNRVVIVVGYQGQNLINYIGNKYEEQLKIEFVENPIYDKTNNIYSLALAKDKLQEDDTLLIESDLIFDDGMFSLLTENPYPNLALVAKYETWMDGTMVRLDDDQNIVAITAAMPSGTSVSMMQDAFPRRTFDVGISEGHAVTFAGGLAREGLRPFVAIYSAFLQRAYDSIINDVSIAHLPVTFCLDRAGLVGEDGVTHHGLFDLAFMRAIPGMTVTAPMDEHTLRNLMYTAQRIVEGPFSIRYPRGSGKMVDWHNEMHTLPLGKGRKLHDGHDVAILSLGTIGTNVVEACESLHEQGIDVAHYDMIYLKPIDEDILDEVAKNYSKIITIEEGTTTGGLGGAVAEWLSGHGVATQLVRMGVPDAFVDQGTVKELHELCHLDAKSIEQQVKQLLNHSTP